MDRVEEIIELANTENDDNVECPVDANFADDWRNSNKSIPNNNHGTPDTIVPVPGTQCNLTINQ